MSSSMSMDDFIAGILSSLKLSKQVQLSAVTNLEEKLVTSFKVLELIAQKKNIELRFHCDLNPLTRRSATAQYGLVRAEKAGILEGDGQALKIALTIEESANIINASPLSLSEWRIIHQNLKREPRRVPKKLSGIEETERLTK